MKKYLMTGIAALAMGGMFTSCSHDMSLYNGNQSEQVVKNYEQAFVNTYGEPASNQTWGFGETVAGTRGMTRSNPGENYPATHDYKDADGNVIAGANMNHNQWGSSDLQSMPYGGWIVPDPLTEGQKLRVQKYFQANPNLSYEDPHFRHFFVQQVYTGGTDAPETGNKEATKAANGTVHTGKDLNQLTVGVACSHINDFNAGTCSSSNVLNHEGETQSDQITLMVNVDDTSCFGYHETGGSNVKGVINHNDKMALVSAAVIDAWAAQNGNPGEAVVDEWNRSFMGFDYELLPEEDIIPENPTYAKITDVPNYNNIPYAWDGTNVMVLGQKPAAVAAGSEIDLTSYFAYCYNGTVTNNEEGINFTSNGWGGLQAYTFGDGNSDWSKFTNFVIEFKEATPVASQIQLGAAGNHNIAAGTTKFELDLTEITSQVSNGTLYVESPGTFKISKIYLVTGAQQDNTLYYDEEYILGNANKIMFYSSSNTNQYGGTIIELSENDMKTTQDGKTCLNLVKFKELADGGYHPISTDLKKWVKWQAACDGYYSDWIVTLTEAKRIGSGEGGGDDESVTEEIRVIAEDLNAKESKSFDEGSDFDFNDVVFDVKWTHIPGVDDKSTQEVKIKLMACGAEYSIYIGSDDDNIEIHDKFAKANDGRGITGRTYTINTQGDRDYNCPEITLLPDSWNGTTIKQIAKSIMVRVSKSGTLYELSAEKGRAASKIAVGTDFRWCDEWDDIDGNKSGYNGKFSKYVSDKYAAEKWNTWYKDAYE